MSWRVGRETSSTWERVVLLAALLALCACDIRGRVLFVGDSNTVYAAPVWQPMVYGGIGLDPWHAPGWLPTQAAIPGASLVDWPESVSAIAAAQGFDATIVALGLNDCMVHGVAPTNDQLDELFDALPAGRIVILDAPYAPGVDQACLRFVNLGLQQQASKRNATYVNVNDILDALPESERYGYGVHYSVTAQQAIGQRLVEVLEAL
jgi:lysophospholipase L1-like esterase